MPNPTKNYHKFHVALNGAMLACNAETRACPRGGHLTLSTAEYDEALENNDPRFAPVTKSTTFTRSVDTEFEKAQEEYLVAKKADDEVKRRLAQWEEENPYPTKGRPILGPAVDRTVEVAKREIRQILEAEGISRTKAGFIIQDMKTEGPDALLPPVKKKDKFDPDIEAKTTAARAKVAENEKVKLARDVIETFNKQMTYQRTRNSQYLAIRDQVAKEQKGLGNLAGATARLEQAQRNLGARRNWIHAGVPLEAEEVSDLANLTPEQVKVNKDGEITNLWYANTVTGEVKPITSYVPGNWEGRNDPGKFYTEDGTEIFHDVRYANYKKNESNPATGETRVLVAPDDNNRPFPTSHLYQGRSFGAYRSLDSGG